MTPLVDFLAELFLDLYLPNLSFRKNRIKNKNTHLVGGAGYKFIVA